MGRERIDPRQRREQRRFGAPDRKGTSRTEVDGEASRPMRPPEGGIFALIQSGHGALDAQDRDLLAVARSVADASDSALIVLGLSDHMAGAGLPTDDADGCADYVLRLGTPAAIFPSPPDIAATTLAALATRLSARHVIAFDDPVRGDLLRRLAVLLGEFPATRVERIAEGSSICRGRDADQAWVRQTPRIVLLDDRIAVPLLEPAAHPALPLTVDLPPLAGTLVDGGLRQLASHELPLPEAPLVLAGGRGVTDWTAFLAAAAAIGAAVGGSRPVCDAGSLPRDRQVGISGVSVSAHCYLAFGISGASQHLQALEHCSRLIAVNLDPTAPLMLAADLAIVADAQAVLGLLPTAVAAYRRS